MPKEMKLYVAGEVTAGFRPLLHRSRVSPYPVVYVTGGLVYVNGIVEAAAMSGKRSRNVIDGE